MRNSSGASTSAAATAAASGASVGVEVAVEHAADEREREPLGAEFADASETVAMLGPVPGDPALAVGRGEQPALLVEADRVDRGVGAAGQFFDPPPLRLVRRHEFRF